MRLTLRTLLAYMDEILEPEDAHALGKKIAESEFAGKLVSRIQGVIRHPRLGAPKLDGRGIAADANSVAEYLDMVLAPDRVPDFEKVCLESESHLAEVASCHQILTLVMGEPAKIDQSGRERMYRIVGLSQQPDVAGRSIHAAHVASNQPGFSPPTPQQTPAGGFPPATHGPAAIVSSPPPPPPPAASPYSTPASPPSYSMGPPGDMPSPAASQSVAGSVEPSAPNVLSSAAAAFGTSGNGAPVGAEESPELQTRTKREVPDYLREQKRTRIWPLLVAVLVAFVIVFGGLRLIGPFDATHPLAAWMGISPPTEVASSAKRPSASDRPSAEDLPSSENPPKDSSATGTGAAGEGATDAARAGQGDPPGAGNVTAKDAGGNAPAGTIPGDASNSAGSGLPLDPARPVVGGVDPKTALPLDPLSPAPGLSPGPGPSLDPAGSPSPDPKSADPNFPEEGGSPENSKPVEVARYLSDDQVLARLTPEGDWARLPTNSSIASGERLAVLPSYRPQLLLSNAVKVTFSGESLVTLAPPDSDGTIAIAMNQGKAIVATVGREGNRIHLAFGPRKLTVHFVQADSLFAVEAFRWLPPGEDPEKVPAKQVVQVFALAGSLDCTLGAEANKLGPGQVLVWIDDAPAEVAAAEPPPWVGALNDSSIERLAARQLEPLLKLDRPITLSLKEHAGDRREEVRSLAIRSLGVLGQYDEFIPALGNEWQRSYWSGHYDILRNALGRGAEEAASVRGTLQRLRGPEGAQLYRLLWGFNSQQLKEGAAPQLVKDLDHEQMDIRVLAFENLKRITGSTNTYLPDMTPARRKASLLRWNARLEEKKIDYATQPSPLPPRKPAPPGTPAPAAPPGPATSPPEPAPSPPVPAATPPVPAATPPVPAATPPVPAVPPLSPPG